MTVRHTSTRKNVAALAVAGLLLVGAMNEGTTEPSGGSKPLPVKAPSSTLLDPEPGAAIWRPLEGQDLIGTKAPPWRDIEWLQGGPLELGELNRDGKAVLLRFWLTGCPYCRRTAPALRALWRRYRDEGLVVVGLHHPKSMETREPNLVERAMRELGYDFPVGLDNSWRTIRSYGVGSDLRNFTSVSFLIDQEGIIRFVHDGGEFHDGGGAGHERCNAAMAALVSTIEEVIGSSRGGTGAAPLR